jgi:hypothetical protein
VFVKGEMVKMHQAPASEEELANHFLAMSEAERRKRLADMFVNLFALYMSVGLSANEAEDEAGKVVEEVGEDLIVLKHERVAN